MPILRSIRNRRLWRLVLPLLVLAIGLPDQAAGAEIPPKSPLYSALAPAFTAVDPNLTRLEVVERRPAGYREGGTEAGGLLRYGKADGTMKRYEVPAVIHAIRRAGDHLYLGASDGLYVLGGEGLTRVELVPDLSGRYFARIAKPVAGTAARGRRQDACCVVDPF